MDDDTYCVAFPNKYATLHASETPFRDEDQRFMVEFKYSKEYILSARKFQIRSYTTHHTFPNVTKDEVMQEATIVPWLVSMGVPDDAHGFVVDKIAECARDMLRGGYVRNKVLPMQVVLVITRASEDEMSDEEDSPEVEEEEEEEEEEDDDDDDYDDDDDDLGLVPASKSLVEGLEMFRGKGCKKERCAICFEDFEVGVHMPCLHVFHKECITDWFRVGNSCPLCRFKMPSEKSD